MKLKLLPLFFMGLTLFACSTPSQKAEKIVSGLGEYDKVLYQELNGKNPELVYSLGINDTIGGVLAYHLATDDVDTLATFYKFIEYADAVPVKDGYLIVAREERRDGNYHYLYTPFIVRNASDAKARTQQFLYVNKDKKDQGSTAYVIDEEAKVIILTSYDYDSNKITLYHTVYDFDGNEISTDVSPFNLRTAASASSGGGASYVWECQKCRRKKNSGSKPSTLDYDGCVNGFWDPHQWVKVGRVD